MKKFFLFFLISLVVFSSAVCVHSQSENPHFDEVEHITEKHAKFDNTVYEYDLNAYFPESDIRFYEYELDSSDITDTLSIDNSILRVSPGSPLEKTVKIKAKDKNGDLFTKEFVLKFIDAPTHITKFLLTLTIILFTILLLCISAFVFSGPTNGKTHIRYISDGIPKDEPPAGVRFKKLGALWILTGCDSAGIFITRKEKSESILLKYIPKKDTYTDNGEESAKLSKVCSAAICPSCETGFFSDSEGNNGIDVFFYTK